jgi:hypothetical protein
MFAIYLTTLPGKGQKRPASDEAGSLPSVDGPASSVADGAAKKAKHGQTKPKPQPQPRVLGHGANTLPKGQNTVRIRSLLKIKISQPGATNSLGSISGVVVSACVANKNLFCSSCQCTKISCSVETPKL